MRGKKYLVLLTGVVQGLLSIGLGVYIDRHHASASNTPSLPVVIILMTLLALVNEIANGANFSLVPHCNPSSNGSMTGIVGAMGNLGGIFFAFVWRYQPQPFGRAFWIAGVVTIVRGRPYASQYRAHRTHYRTDCQCSSYRDKGTVPEWIQAE